MDTFAVITLDFAKAYGVYILITGLAGLLAPDRWKLVMDDYAKSPGLTYLTATLVVGLGLVLARFTTTGPIRSPSSSRLSAGSPWSKALC